MQRHRAGHVRRLATIAPGRRTGTSRHKCQPARIKKYRTPGPPASTQLNEFWVQSPAPPGLQEQSAGLHAPVRDQTE
eukprot:CAMPEP_0179264662 /NCGR_PEP_ID=MMETSP0797-20121207/28506_1 /TAXON_ID=47934 /ORGANISM="Dinophysis acuminata, Strain DAEP01" /LENGTH=76 /DNA_ID=CAMNT_0020972851 /DNA_START=476 /DNA_END=704 /DNA_ORIENTATION=+